MEENCHLAHRPHCNPKRSKAAETCTLVIGPEAMRGHPREKTSNRCAAHRRKDADLGLKDTIAHANDVAIRHGRARRAR